MIVTILRILFAGFYTTALIMSYRACDTCGENLVCVPVPLLYCIGAITLIKMIEISNKIFSDANIEKLASDMAKYKIRRLWKNWNLGEISLHHLSHTHHCRPCNNIMGCV